MIEGNTPVSPNEWEQVKRFGNDAIKKWIDDNMKYRSCVVVLIGSETASRPWVQYEIKKAWMDRKGLLGIYESRFEQHNPTGCKCNGITGEVLKPISF